MAGPAAARVINLDTMLEIEFCVMADDVTGEYRERATDEFGAKLVQVIGEREFYLSRDGKCRLKIEPIYNQAGGGGKVTLGRIVHQYSPGKTAGAQP